MNRRAGAVALATVLALSGCTAGRSAPGRGQLAEGRTFTMVISQDPGNLDPTRTVQSVTRTLGGFLYSRLLHRSPVPGGEPLPGLAQRWQADARTAVFTLRPGLRCADGTPLTAADVAANINFIGDPKNGSPLAGLQVMPGTSATAEQDTVTVTSGAPDPFLLTNLGGLAIACGAGLGDRAGLAKGKHATGLFTMTELVPNDHYTLTRNRAFTAGPGDWRPDTAGLPEKVIFRVIPNEGTAANLLISGQVNATVITGPDQHRLRSLAFPELERTGPAGLLLYNQAQGRPTADPALRRALTQALDLPQVAKVLTSGRAKPAPGLLVAEPRTCQGDPVAGNLPGHDLAAAAAALDAAGWRAGADGIRVREGKQLTLQLLQPSSAGPTMTAAAELVQQGWQRLGVRAVIQPADAAGLNQVLFSTGEWDVSMAPLGVLQPNQVVPIVSGPPPPRGMNLARIQNAEFEQKARQAAELVGTQGCELWNAAEAALYRAVDAVPYAGVAQTIFSRGAEFTYTDTLEPTSIRMFTG